MIIHMEGPDRCGKTTLSKRLADDYNLAYWRNDDADELLRNNPDAWKSVLQFYYSKIPMFAKMLASVNKGLILDRNYISEWVYSQVFDRDTDRGIIGKLEGEYSDMGAVIIYCYKDTYEDFDDEFIKRSQIDEIRALYCEYFQTHAQMPVLYLNTTDENLYTQLGIIAEFLEENK